MSARNPTSLAHRRRRPERAARLGCLPAATTDAHPMAAGVPRHFPTATPGADPRAPHRRREVSDNRFVAKADQPTALPNAALPAKRSAAQTRHLPRPVPSPTWPILWRTAGDDHRAPEIRPASVVGWPCGGSRGRSVATRLAWTTRPVAWARHGAPRCCSSDLPTAGTRVPCGGRLATARRPFSRQPPTISSPPKPHSVKPEWSSQTGPPVAGFSRASRLPPLNRPRQSKWRETAKSLATASSDSRGRRPLAHAREPLSWHRQRTPRRIPSGGVERRSRSCSQYTQRIESGSRRPRLSIASTSMLDYDSLHSLSFYSFDNSLTFDQSSIDSAHLARPAQRSG